MVKCWKCIGGVILKNSRIEYLDSLRGVAAMIVVIFHCMISFVIFHAANYKSEYQNGTIKFITESPLKILWSGTEPVLLFFILSGFVLSISFLNGRSFNYKIFIARRFSRIYIPYIVIMIISVILASTFLKFNSIEGMSGTFDNRWDHPVTLKAIFAYIFMINYDAANVNGVVWTLFHEMRVSIIFPFIMLIVMKWNALKSFVINGVLIVGCWITFLLIAKNTTGSISLIAGDFHSTAFYTMFFVFGATLSKYRVETADKISKLTPFMKFLLFSLSIILIGARWVEGVVPILSSNVHQLVAGLGIVLLFAVVLSSALAQKILMNKFLLWLGKVSFSLYLIHVLVLMLLAIIFGKYAIWLTPILSLPVAGLTYKYVEEPAIKIGKRWTSILNGKSKPKEKIA